MKDDDDDDEEEEEEKENEPIPENLGRRGRRTAVLESKLRVSTRCVFSELQELHCSASSLAVECKSAIFCALSAAYFQLKRKPSLKLRTEKFILF